MGQTAEMRIAIIHYTAMPVLGGVEVVIDAHARLFAANGHEVQVICSAGGVARERIAVRNLRRSSDSLSVEERVDELRPLLAESDLVMVHNVTTMHFDLVLTEALWELAGALPQVRFIAWVHDVAAVNPDYQLAGLDSMPGRLLRTAGRRWEYVAVSERRAQEWASVSGMPKGKIRVVPNGVEPAEVLGLSGRVSNLAEVHGLWDRDLILLHPTRLLRRKNVELGLSVVEALKDRGIAATYLVTAAADAQNPASAKYADELTGERTKRGLDNEVVFLSEEAAVSHEDLRSLYRISDALFFPSRQEGFGLPMLEAALHRIPAFCADIEPLRGLPGALPFSLDATPVEIGENIIRHFAEWSANPPRRAVLRSFIWSAIYRNNLAPLIATRNNPLQAHETLGSQ